MARFDVYQHSFLPSTHETNGVSSRQLLGLFAYASLVCATFVCAYGQQDPAPTLAATQAGALNGASHADPQDKRAFGFIPNYKTTDASLPYQSISSKEKAIIATKDSFDWTIPIVAAGYAGLGQITNQNRPLGQGFSGYANRFVRTYSDQILGNMLVEAAVPILLKEDPRYFRRGHGTFWSRVAYSCSRIFVTRTDSGGSRFNYSELIGNSLAVGVSNSYYPGSRNLGGNFGKLSLQLATDAISNALKEFWPDVKHKMPRQHTNP
jgi:hypothetical protein